jgi:hypothetical protein
MQSKKFNIAKAKKWINAQGEEKTFWATVGTYTEFYKQDGSIGRIIEIPAIGLDASVFEITERNSPDTQTTHTPAPVQTNTPTNATPSNTAPATNNVIEYPADEINPDDINF